MKITDEMVEAGIVADLEFVRRIYPEIARWPDDFDEEERQQERAQMRAILTAALATQPTPVVDPDADAKRLAWEWGQASGRKAHGNLETFWNYTPEEDRNGWRAVAKEKANG